jgi:hypothetical protein
VFQSRFQMPPSRLHLPLTALSAFVFALAASFTPAKAGMTVYRLGDQDFASGAGPILVDQAKAAGAGEPKPFDGTVYGDDRNGLFGKIRFSYSFAPIASAADSMLTLGLIGLDSPPGKSATVKLYLNGVEQPNAALAGVSSPSFPASASVVTIPVPSSLLTNGKLDVEIKAFRHSPGFSGNAIEADFSTLSIGTPDVNPGGGGQNPGGGGNPGGGTDPGGNGGGGNNGGGNNGGNNNGGGGNNGGGNGGGSGPVTVPLPSASYAGLLGLALCVIAMRRRTADR